MSKKLSFDDFIVVLHELDNTLTENITIKAIGGFSIILNSQVLNLNIQRLSEDIDSLTTTWNNTDKYTYQDIEKIVESNKNIDSLIWNIGEKYDINTSDGWLNNSWYDSKLFNDELESFIEWLEYDKEQFKHIKILYADLESIFLFKIRAVNDIITGKNITHDTPRNNDVYDIKNILEIFNEEDILNLKNDKLAKAIELYEPAVQWLSKKVRLYN